MSIRELMRDTQVGTKAPLHNNQVSPRKVQETWVSCQRDLGRCPPCLTTIPGWVGGWHLSGCRRMGGQRGPSSRGLITPTTSYLQHHKCWQ